MTLPLPTLSYSLPSLDTRPLEGRNFMRSVLLHALVAGMVFLMFLPVPSGILAGGKTWRPLPLPVLPNLEMSGAGGNNHDKEPSSKGLPPAMNVVMLMPPTHRAVDEPELAVPITIQGPNTPAPLGVIGNPFGTNKNPSFGDKGGDGIGDGDKGDHVGDGDERGIYRPGRGGVSSPEAISTPEPDYTDEGRKAHVQGVVRMRVIINASGHVASMRVIGPLGYGLDEQALRAVQNWRFKPAMKDGKPVSVSAEVEVHFGLY